MRKLIAAVLALLMLCSSALAAQDAPIASYGLPEGAEVFYMSQAAEMAIPEGLEPVYRLMSTTSARQGDIYLIRMQNGRALASVSCVPVSQEMTAQQLADLWPQIMQTLKLEGAEVDAGSAVVSAESLYGGIDMLHIQTRLGLTGPSGMIWLDAEGVAFCRNGELTECWAVCPESGFYPGDSAEADQLSRDRRDLKLFMDSLSFPETWEEMMTGISYQDRDGRFAVVLPQDAVVLDVHSTPEEVSAARDRFIQLNPAGAAHAFDCFMQEVYDERTVLVLTADMQGVIQIFASQEENFRGATAEQLCMLAQPILQLLQEKFDVAACLADNERMEVSCREHALLGYWVRSGELDMMLDIMACVLEDDWLYEIDIYAAEGDQNVRTVLHTFVQQSMIYTPPQNGLE